MRWPAGNLRQDDTGLPDTVILSLLEMGLRLSLRLPIHVRNAD